MAASLSSVTPDVPDPANFSFTQKILWMVPNIDLSPSTRVFPSPDFPVSKNARHVSQLPPALIPYLPPHPTQGSGDHRFTFLVLRHDGPITFGEKDARNVVAIPDRDDFNFRQWSQSIAKRKIKTNVRNKEEKRTELNLNVVGCSFFRSSYDPVECPKIWQLLIQKPEVKFNIPGGTSNREYLTSLGQNKVQKWNLENNFTGPGQPRQGTKREHISIESRATPLPRYRVAYPRSAPSVFQHVSRTSTTRPTKLRLDRSRRLSRSRLSRTCRLQW